MSNSKQTTYRFFVDNKRVATAIFWDYSGYIQKILEVFPLQTTILQHGRRLMAIFHSEEEWRKHCLRDYVPKYKTRVETITTSKTIQSSDKTETKEQTIYRFFVNDKYVSTAIPWRANGLTDPRFNRVLETYPARKGKNIRCYNNLEDWRDHCERDYVPKSTTRFEVVKKEVDKKEVSNTEEEVPNTKSSDKNKETYRLYAGDKHISTAVVWKNGSKTDILEVYPAKLKERIYKTVYESLTDWRECWEDKCNTNVRIEKSVATPKQK